MKEKMKIIRLLLLLNALILPINAMKRSSHSSTTCKAKNIYVMMDMSKYARQNTLDTLKTKLPTYNFHMLTEDNNPEKIVKHVLKKEKTIYAIGCSMQRGSVRWRASTFTAKTWDIFYAIIEKHPKDVNLLGHLAIIDDPTTKNQPYNINIRNKKIPESLVTVNIIQKSDFDHEDITGPFYNLATQLKLHCEKPNKKTTATKAKQKPSSNQKNLNKPFYNFATQLKPHCEKPNKKATTTKAKQKLSSNQKNLNKPFLTPSYTQKILFGGASLGLIVLGKIMVEKYCSKKRT